MGRPPARCDSLASAALWSFSTGTDSSISSAVGRRRTCNRGLVGAAHCLRTARPTARRLGPAARARRPWTVRSGAVALGHRALERAHHRDVKLPGPPDVRAALRDLDRTRLERAASAVAACTRPACCRAPVLAHWRRRPRCRAVNRRAVAARCEARRPRPAIAGDCCAGATMGHRAVASRAACHPAGLQPSAACMGRLRRRRKTSTGALRFAQAKPEIDALFTAGLLEPVVAATAPAGWPQHGRPASHQLRSKLAQLLDAAPVHHPDRCRLAGSAVAEWWGSVRRLVATGPIDLRETSWSRWSELDSAFLPWLRDRYGTLLSSAAPWPSAVHRIAPFLARRLARRSGRARAAYRARRAWPRAVGAPSGASRPRRAGGWLDVRSRADLHDGVEAGDLRR